MLKSYVAQKVETQEVIDASHSIRRLAERLITMRLVPGYTVNEIVQAFRGVGTLENVITAKRFVNVNILCVPQQEK